MKRLLLIEGSNIDAMDASAAIDAVAPAEFSVVSCKTIQEALNLLKDESFDVLCFGLISSDSNLKEELLELTNFSGGTPIIVSLRQSELDLASIALGFGAQAFVIKGLSNFGDLLVQVLNEAINSNVMKYELSQCKLNAKLQRDEFIAILAHDLKNPLIGEQQVLSSILAAMKNTLPDIYYESLVSLRRSNISSLLMVTNQIDLYRLEAQERSFAFENVDLIRPINEVIENFGFFLQSAEMKIVKHDFPSSLGVQIDVSAFVRIFSNLLHNACRFAKKGSQINLYLKSDSEKFQFEVESFGPSIKPENKSILFKRYKRSLSGQKYLHSAGIGLYLCNELAQRLQGTLDCICEGESTRIKLELPITISDT